MPTKALMKIQKQLVEFVTRANWVIFFAVSMVGLLTTSYYFAFGIICGGLIVTINFHLLAKTLKKALTPEHLSSHNVVLAKYYIRFIISGLIIFILIAGHYVNPIGLVIGLSVVVASIMIATVREVIKFILLKEAI
jgi:hypothetical protein